jgi:uncharacterized membrane protein YsdA (DUF1294 family)
MQQSWLFLAAYLAAINLAGFLSFAWDKHRARNHGWRIPERTLLMLAAGGGSVGTAIGQRVFRHKTWKEPFRTRLRWVIIGQVVVLVGVAWLLLR